MAESQFQAIDTDVFDRLQEDLAAQADRQRGSQFNMADFADHPAPSMLQSNWIADRTTVRDPRTGRRMQISMDEADDLDLQRRVKAATELDALQKGRLGFDRELLGRERDELVMEQERVKFRNIESGNSFMDDVQSNIDSGMSTPDAINAARKKNVRGFYERGSEVGAGIATETGIEDARFALENPVAYQEMKAKERALQIKKQEQELEQTNLAIRKIGDADAEDKFDQEAGRHQAYASLFPDPALRAQAHKKAQGLGPDDEQTFDAGLRRIHATREALVAQQRQYEVYYSEEMADILTIAGMTEGVETSDGINSQERELILDEMSAAQQSSFGQYLDAMVATGDAISAIDQAMNPEALFAEDAQPIDALAAVQAVVDEAHNSLRVANETAKVVLEFQKEQNELAFTRAEQERSNERLRVAIQEHASEADKDALNASIQFIASKTGNKYFDKLGAEGPLKGLELDEIKALRDTEETREVKEAAYKIDNILRDLIARGDTSSPVIPKLTPGPRGTTYGPGQ